MAKSVKAIEIKKIVVKVGDKELSLSVEEARDLCKALDALVGDKNPITVAPVVYPPVVYPPVSYPPVVQPVIPYDPWGTPWVSPYWTCESSDGIAIFNTNNTLEG